MKKFGKTECPYCGKKIGVLGAWILKTQGEYRCPQCGGYSNIVMSGRIFIFAAVAALLSMIIFLVSLVAVHFFSVISIVLVALPFALFFLISPFFVQLKKPQVRRQPPGGPQRQRPPAPPQREREASETRSEMDQTIVMDPVKRE